MICQDMSGRIFGYVWNIFSDLSGTYSDILSGILADILSNILLSRLRSGREYWAWAVVVEVRQGILGVDGRG